MLGPIFCATARPESTAPMERARKEAGNFMAKKLCEQFAGLWKTRVVKFTRHVCRRTFDCFQLQTAVLQLRNEHFIISSYVRSVTCFLYIKT